MNDRYLPEETYARVTKEFSVSPVWSLENNKSPESPANKKYVNALIHASLEMERAKKRAEEVWNQILLAEKQVSSQINSEKTTEKPDQEQRYISTVEAAADVSKAAREIAAQRNELIVSLKETYKSIVERIRMLEVQLQMLKQMTPSLVFVNENAPIVTVEDHLKFADVIADQIIKNMTPVSPAAEQNKAEKIKDTLRNEFRQIAKKQSDAGMDEKIQKVYKDHGVHDAVIQNKQRKGFLHELEITFAVFRVMEISETIKADLRNDSIQDSPAPRPFNRSKLKKTREFMNDYSRFKEPTESESNLFAQKGIHYIQNILIAAIQKEEDKLKDCCQLLETMNVSFDNLAILRNTSPALRPGFVRIEGEDDNRYGIKF